MNFSESETNIIKYWQSIDLTKQMTTNELHQKNKPTTDGPPFCTSTPHAGHILVSCIKDIMARYNYQFGYKLPLQLGWDTHGLPMEQAAEKIVGKVSQNDSIERLTEFNNCCRNIINNCSDNWYDTLGRLGRQFDRDQSYFTCNLSYMKTIWWAFEKLWSQGLVYKSKKVMAYSGACMTVLSNFEADSNYQNRTDISVYIKFKLINSDESIIIWTTTPWSLFANQGICVNANLDYSLINVNNQQYWLCSTTINKLFDKYDIIKTVKGIELLGLEYEPIFNFTNASFKHKIVVDDYVKDDTGTGLVHLAPLYGEDDMRVMKNNGYSNDLIPSYIVNEEVKFTIDYNVNGKNIKDQFVMDTSTDIVIHLKKMGIAIKSEKIEHSYPHCPRTDTPLVYLAIDSWFINVKKIIPELVENNKQIRWYPEDVGTKRFGNWIANAQDWNVSRSRVWGTPLPIWVNETNPDDYICINSVEELERLTGKEIDDLHIDKIGDIIITNEKGVYKRVPYIFDCWFESGLATIAKNYNITVTPETFIPDDFISEGIDQTRGWFYTLHVLSTALFNKPAFKNVIVLGHILADDGKKMSKRLQNYTSPTELINKYGADVIRLYLSGSGAARAESMCFKDVELGDIIRKLVPYFNSFVMLRECYTFVKDNFEGINWLEETISENKLDIWIKNTFVIFVNSVRKHMDNLEIAFVPNHIYKFIDNLCNVFIKLSRERMKYLHSETDCKEALSTLYWILNKSNKVFAPFMPHLAEHCEKSLYSCFNDKDYTSVHLQEFNYDEFNEYKIDATLMSGIYSLNEVLETVRSLRLQIEKPVYYPLNNIDLYTDNLDIGEFKTVICIELNIKNINIYPTRLLNKQYKSNRKVLGKIYKKDVNKYIEMIESGNISFDGCQLEYYTSEIKYENKDNMIGKLFTYKNEINEFIQSVVYLDTQTNEDNDNEAEINNIRRQVNIIRKDMGLKIYNKIIVTFENNDFWETQSEELKEKLSTRLIATIKYQDFIDTFKVLQTYKGKELKVQITII